MTNRTAADLVAQARERVENLSVDEAAAELQAGEALLVDIREPAELTEQGRIVGSVWVPRGMLEFRADPSSPYHLDGLKPDRRVILHCASGGRSALAASVLQELGYTRAAHLDGGLTAWKQAGHPTV